MKIAVLFPGIGYHCDKPLLYYSGKLAIQYAYEVIKVPYTNLSRSIPEAYTDAYSQTEKFLENTDWNKYDDILFLSKSIGTIIATAYAQNHNIPCRNVYYTPLAQTFDFSPQPGIVFHGTNDSWAETAEIREKCRVHNLPLHIIENANHSLELQTESSLLPTHAQGTVLQNLQILTNVMALTEQYIAR